MCSAHLVVRPLAPLSTRARRLPNTPPAAASPPKRGRERRLDVERRREVAPRAVSTAPAPTAAPVAATSPTPPPPTVAEVMAITGASYPSAYRWTTGRSRFPLDAFVAVTRARGADLATAMAWAEHWLKLSNATAGADGE